MRTLVTGGTGFIGSTLVHALDSAGHSVVVVDDLRRGGVHNLDGTSAELFAVDINDRSLVDIVGQAQPEVVFHLAAQIDVRSSVTDPLDDATQNVLGTINVAMAAHAAGTRKVVFSSSGGSIYGEPGGLPISEGVPVNPASPYAASKVSGEVYLNMFRELHGLDCTHLALSNVYGPRQDPHGEAGVVAIFSNALLQGRRTTLFGDGSNTRDYVYVDDVAAAFIAAAGAVGSGRRYNIGTGVQTTDRELHHLTARAANAPEDPDWAPPRLGDLAASALDPARAARELGWRPTVDIEEGIQRTVAYFRSSMNKQVPVSTSTPSECRRTGIRDGQPVDHT